MKQTCCNECKTGSGGFVLGLIIGLIIGAVIAIIIYRHSKSEVIQVLKRKINKFILSFENGQTTRTKPARKTRFNPPKTFLAK